MQALWLLFQYLWAPMSSARLILWAVLFWYPLMLWLLKSFLPAPLLQGSTSSGKCLAVCLCICSQNLSEKVSLMRPRVDSDLWVNEYSRISLRTFPLIFLFLLVLSVVFGSTLVLWAISFQVPGYPGTTWHKLSFLPGPQVFGWPLPQALSHHCPSTSWRWDRL